MGVVRCCRAWLPDVVLPAGDLLREALKGEDDVHLAHLRRKYPAAQFNVMGQATMAVAPEHRLHAVALCEEASLFEAVAAEISDLAETACDIVADDLGLSEEEVQQAFESIRLEKWEESQLDAIQPEVQNIGIAKEQHPSVVATSVSKPVAPYVLPLCHVAAVPPERGSQFHDQPSPLHPMPMHQAQAAAAQSFRCKANAQPNPLYPMPMPQAQSAAAVSMSTICHHAPAHMPHAPYAIMHPPSVDQHSGYMPRAPCWTAPMATCAHPLKPPYMHSPASIRPAGGGSQQAPQHPPAADQFSAQPSAHKDKGALEAHAHALAMAFAEDADSPDPGKENKDKAAGEDDVVIVAEDWKQHAAAQAQRNYIEFLRQDESQRNQARLQAEHLAQRAKQRQMQQRQMQQRQVQQQQQHEPQVQNFALFLKDYQLREKPQAQLDSAARRAMEHMQITEDFMRSREATPKTEKAFIASDDVSRLRWRAEVDLAQEKILQKALHGDGGRNSVATQPQNLRETHEDEEGVQHSKKRKAEVRNTDRFKNGENRQSPARSDVERRRSKRKKSRSTSRERLAERGRRRSEPRSKDRARRGGGTRQRPSRSESRRRRGSQKRESRRSPEPSEDQKLRKSRASSEKRQRGGNARQVRRTPSKEFVDKELRDRGDTRRGILAQATKGAASSMGQKPRSRSRSTRRDQSPESEDSQCSSSDSAFRPAKCSIAADHDPKQGQAVKRSAIRLGAAMLSEFGGEDAPVGAPAQGAADVDGSCESADHLPPPVDPPSNMLAVRHADQWDNWKSAWEMPQVPSGWVSMLHAGPNGGPFELRVFDDKREVWRYPLMKPCVVIGSSLKASHLADLSHESIKEQHAALVQCSGAFFLEPVNGKVRLSAPSCHAVVVEALVREQRLADAHAGDEGLAVEVAVGEGKRRMNTLLSCFQLARSRLVFFVDLAALATVAAESPSKF